MTLDARNIIVRRLFQLLRIYYPNCHYQLRVYCFRRGLPRDWVIQAKTTLLWLLESNYQLFTPQGNE